MSAWRTAAESAEDVRPSPDSFLADRGGGRPADAARDLGDARARIRALVSIAAGHGSSVSLEELYALLPVGAFENARAVERFVAEDDLLRSELEIRRGEVVPLQSGHLVARREGQRRLTADRLRLAEDFATRLGRACPGIDLVAVSGSTAFDGARPEDDVDFFLVTQRGRMWVALALSMGMSKLVRMRDPRVPSFCFYRVTEREPCVASFGRPGDALFAREALSLKVVRGSTFLRWLLGSAGWMETPFPNLYRARLAGRVEAPPSPDWGGSSVWSVANVLAFLGLAPYLWLAGLVRNVRLRRQGRADAVFRTVVSFRFFSYESRKFEALRERYAGAF